eukprot:8536422-Karenia_brevis.AAC.1
MDDADAMDHQGNSSNQSEEAFPDPPDFMDGGAIADGQPERRRDTGQTQPLATHCGTLPTGCALEDFHQPPAC